MAFCPGFNGNFRQPSSKFTPNIRTEKSRFYSEFYLSFYNTQQNLTSLNDRCVKISVDYHTFNKQAITNNLKNHASFYKSLSDISVFLLLNKSYES